MRLQLAADGSPDGGATWRSCVTASTRPSDFARPARTIASGQHHGHRLDRIDQARQAHRPAEAGMQAEHHLRKAEPRILDRDAVVAGERELRARRRGNSRG